MARKPTQKQRDEAEIEKGVNLDRDLKEISRRLGEIETSVKAFEQRDGRIAALEYKNADMEKRIATLEGYFSGGIKTVVGAVLVAIVSLVVGVSRQ